MVANSVACGTGSSIEIPPLHPACNRTPVRQEQPRKLFVADVKQHMIKHRIMVVDDDEDVRFVVTTLLGIEFETVQAQNGLDAIEKIERSQPDLLLLDINMPIMNGIQCCRAIQRNPEFSDLPVFFLSAASNPAVREEALQVGGRAFFDKPFESSKLIEDLKAWLRSEGKPAREKRYTVDQISAIDATPLLAAEEQDEDEPLGSFELETSRPADLKALQRELDGDHSGGRTRRVFGKQKPAPPPPAPAAPAPSDDDSQVVLPPPPKPDYQRISQSFQKQPILYGRKKEEEEKKAEPPPRATPAPPRDYGVPPELQKAAPPPPVAPPPPPANREMRPTAPPPRRPTPPPAPLAPEKPAELSPAEILAQRRLAALGKSRSSATRKPRILVLIDQREQLAIYHGALRGLAEFLPLEDPVEAIELIARFQPDLVIAAIIEKAYSGLQLAGMMRGNRRLAHIETIFVQGPWVESKHLAAARTLSKNRIIQLPLSEDRIRDAVSEVVGRPGFQVREKSLKYGEYVNEVIRAAEAEREEQNKALQKQSYRDRHASLRQFMASELKDYKEPEGYDELKGIGRKVHSID